MNPPGIFALKYRQRSDRVVIAHASSLFSPSALTVSLWVKLDAPSSTGYLICKKQYFALAVKNQSLMVAVGNTIPGWVWKNSKVLLSANKWVNVAFTFSEKDQNVRLFVQGQLVKQFEMTGSGPLRSTKNSLYIGLRLVNDFITGQISDVRIWKKAFSPDELLHAVLTPPNIGQAPDLIGWWKTDTGYGSILFDLSMNANNGVITDAVWSRVTHEVPKDIPSTLVDDMRSMFNNPAFSDVHLVSDDDSQRIYAHRIILSQRSDVFKAMLTSGVKESNAKEITIKDISSPVLHQLIEFLYTDTCTLTGDTVLELCTAADKYHVTRLKLQCEAFMQENISLENVCHILVIADQFNITALRAECVRHALPSLTWILQNFFEVIKTDAYLALDKELLREINYNASSQYSPVSKKRKAIDLDADDNNGAQD